MSQLWTNTVPSRLRETAKHFAKRSSKPVAFLICPRAVDLIVDHPDIRLCVA